MTEGDRLDPVPDDAVELVALDLEGSGAQDRDNEAILEIAVVPIIDWEPQPSTSYCTLINPGRPIPRKPWISPGLTDTVLASAPTIAQVEPRLAAMINGRYIVGHNVHVDWRLLHRLCPTVQPRGLIDTLRIARATAIKGSRSLEGLAKQLDLTQRVSELAQGSQPHRAFWDTYAAALVLKALVVRMPRRPTVAELISPTGGSPLPDQPAEHPSLFE